MTSEATINFYATISNQDSEKENLTDKGMAIEKALKAELDKRDYPYDFSVSLEDVDENEISISIDGTGDIEFHYEGSYRPATHEDPPEYPDLIDDISPEDLCDELEKCINTAFEKISEAVGIESKDIDVQENDYLDVPSEEQRMEMLNGEAEYDPREDYGDLD